MLVLQATNEVAFILLQQRHGGKAIAQLKTANQHADKEAYGGVLIWPERVEEGVEGGVQNVQRLC